MNRRQFNALAGQALVALVLGVTAKAHSCIGPHCPQCQNATVSQDQRQS